MVLPRDVSKRKAADVRQALLPSHLTWWSNPGVMVVPLPGPDRPFDEVTYGWWALSWQGRLIIKAVARRGTTTHAMRDAAPDADPATVLAEEVRYPYRGGWSQGPGVMYHTLADALLAARLEAQSVYAAGLALVDQAYAAALANGGK